jgi:hypothetical protein
MILVNHGSCLISRWILPETVIEPAGKGQAEPLLLFSFIVFFYL